jgi:pilus assembly protein CpaF
LSPSIVILGPELEPACGRVLERLQRPLLSPETPQAGAATSPDFAAELDSALRDESPDRRDRLRAEILGDGPLVPVLNDENVTEIVINGRDSIWCERDGKFARHTDRFLADVTLENFRHRLCHEAGLNPDYNIPCADGRWRGFRAHLIGPPLAEGFQITLRRQARDVWSFARLAAAGWATLPQLAVLGDWLAGRKNFLICGPTGSGKTSVLNACLQALEPEERVVCLEDTSELVPLRGAGCKLLTRTEGRGCVREYSLADLVRQSLRMRPSRLVLGEVRGPEAKDLLLALATGHQGSLGTLHATDPKQALLRLEMLVQLGGGQWDHQAVRQLIQLSVDGIAVCHFNDGKRRLDGLYRIASLETFGFLLERVA